MDEQIIKVIKMAATKIIFHVLKTENDEMTSVQQALESLGYDIEVDFQDIFQWGQNCRLDFKVSENNFEILIIKPEMASWEWLNVLIKISQKYPDLPVILYSPHIKYQKDRSHLAEGMPIFFAENEINLNKRVKDIIIIYKVSKSKILFVDDEEQILKSYKRILRKSPWEIFTASNGKTALKILEKENIDLLITDIKMPTMHGIELINRVREKDKEIPVIVCSAYKGLKGDQELRFHKIATFIDKPIDVDVLINKINELL